MKSTKKILNLGFWTGINDFLIKEIGINQTFILMKHVTYSELKNKELPNFREWLTAQTGISKKVQCSAEKTLVEHGFLSMESKGQGGKYYYTVNVENVVKSIESLKETITNKKEIPVSLPFVTKHYIEVDTLSKDKERINNPPSQTTETTIVKKSRLNHNKDDTHGVVVESDLTSRTNLATGKNIIIPKKTKECIDYWNSFPELTTHRTDKSTGLINQAITLLGKFFKGEGTFLDVVIIPKGFKDHKWFNTKATVEDFCDIVDDFIYCIRSPEVKPANNGSKYNLVNFLKGSEYINTQNGGMPSLMLLYCFGEYKTVIVDENPRSTEKMKTMWNTYIGKFKDTPGTEKAFVLVSNLCAQRLKEKREIDSNWIPAMNDYQADGIFRQIILNKQEWFKKENKSPEFMDTGFFTTIIRKYDYDSKTGTMIL